MDIKISNCYYHIDIFDKIKSLFCKHDWESGDLHNFHEHNVWCKKCKKIKL